MKDAWPIKHLGEVVELKYGKAMKAEARASNGRFPVYGSNGVVGTSDTPLVEHPTIVIGRKGAVGEARLAEAGCWPIDTTFYTVLRPSHEVNLRFLLFQLWSLDLKGRAITSTIPGLNRDTLASQFVTIPPPPEQERIVRLLDAAEELRRLRAAADRRTADLIPALFYDMFGAPATNPRGWETKTLGDLTSFVTSGSRGWARYYSNNGARFIRVQDLTDHHLAPEEVAFVSPPESAESTRASVRPGDLLLSITGVVGLTAIAPPNTGPAYVSQHVAIIRLKGPVEPVFVAHFLAHPAGGQRQFSEMQYGQTKPGLNLTQVRGVRILCPPLPLQSEFAVRVAETRVLEAQQASSRRRLDDLFQSMLHRAFRGEL